MRGFLKVLVLLTAGVLGAQEDVNPEEFDPGNFDIRGYSNLAPKVSRADFYFQSGMDELKKGQLKTAAALFHKALVEDVQYAEAHYRLALTFSLLRSEAGVMSPCDDLYMEKIETHLKRALTLTPKLRSLFLGEPGFTPIKSFPNFLLLSLDPKAGPRDWLVSIPFWYGPKPGVYPASPRVKFYPDGRVSYEFFDMSCEENPNFAPAIWGSYQVAGDGIRIELPGTWFRNRVYQGLIRSEVVGGAVEMFFLDFPRSEDFPGGINLIVDPDECSA